jgi:hypothetical protein
LFHLVLSGCSALFYGSENKGLKEEVEIVGKAWQFYSSVGGLRFASD